MNNTFQPGKCGVIFAKLRSQASPIDAAFDHASRKCLGNRRNGRPTRFVKPVHR
jgi:hypothetical protein